MFTPVLAKHSKSFSLIDCVSVGVDRMQGNFEPMRKQVGAWQKSELSDVTAKVVIHEAFVEGELEVPKHLACTVHDLYFEPKYEAFRSRTIWSLSNAFTSAFKQLEPIPQFKATAKLVFAVSGICPVCSVRHASGLSMPHSAQNRCLGPRTPETGFGCVHCCSQKIFPDLGGKGDGVSAQRHGLWISRRRGSGLQAVRSYQC